VGGGVRGLDDLNLISRLGCDGALVATALHNGRLTASDVLPSNAGSAWSGPTRPL